MRAYGVVMTGMVAAFVAFGAPAAPRPDATPVPQLQDPAPVEAGVEPGGALRAGTDLAPLRLPGIIPGQEDAILLHEIAGQAVTLRVTPVDEDDTPADGGRVIVLRPDERRTVHLTGILPFEDLVGRRLLLETLRGAGVAEIEARWLTTAESAAVAASATAHIPRRHLAAGTPATSEELIDRAETTGTLSHESAVLYRVYATFGDARLPAAYRGDDSQVFESLYLSTVVSEWGTYSPATQAALKPFLMPPIYHGSWASPAAAVSPVANAVALDVPPLCDLSHILVTWDFKEDANGKVRVWYDTSVPNDAGQAALFASAADSTIWPTYAKFMAGHEPLPDGSTSCNGGNARLDIYLTDIPRSLTPPHSNCSNSPAFIVITRSETVMTLAHEIFHAFQYSFQIGGCLTDANYRWWTEGSATWAEQYLFPNDWRAIQSAGDILNFPERPLDSTLANNERVYGTFIVPFYIQNRYFPADPQFVGQAWVNCRDTDAIHAVDAATASKGGLATLWHEIALRDWNYPSVDDYTTWRPLMRSLHASPQANWLVGAQAQPDYEFNHLKMDLGHLTATYKHFEFQGSEISSVAFFNGATFNLQKNAVPDYGPFWDPQPATADQVKGVKVQAVITIEGKAPRVEDWTDKPFVTFCRDTVAERLQELTIVISNARLDDSGGNAVPPGKPPVLWVSNIGCWKWTGSAHYQITGQGTGTQTDDATDVVWTHASADNPPPKVVYQATGTINVGFSNGCSGGGAFAPTPGQSILTTYNYTPADAAVRGGYSGSAFEPASIPNVVCGGKPGYAQVGLWFTVIPPETGPPVLMVSPDGKRLFGSYADPGVGATWRWDFKAQRE